MNHDDAASVENTPARTWPRLKTEIYQAISNLAIESNLRYSEEVRSEERRSLSLRPVVPLAHETDNQHENAEETTETDRAVDDAKDHELRGPVCRLKGC